MYQRLVSGGLYQIDFRVPNISAGDQLLAVPIGGMSSQTGTVLNVGRW